MSKTMRWCVRALGVAAVGAMLLSSPTAAAQRRSIVIVHPVPVWGWGPFLGYPYYPYGYPGDYMDAHYGYVKLDTHHQDKNDSVYVDGGFAAKVKDAKKFALRPGNHDIELRASNGHSIFQERVAVTVGKTTKVDVPS